MQHAVRDRHCGCEAIDHYIHTEYKDIEEVYRQHINKVGIPL